MSTVECEGANLIGDDNLAIIQENVQYSPMRVRAVLTYFCTDYDVTMHVWQSEGIDTYRLVNSIPLVNPPGAAAGELVLVRECSVGNWSVYLAQSVALDKSLSRYKQTQ